VFEGSLGGKMKASTLATSEEVSATVCAERGHNIVMFVEPDMSTVTGSPYMAEKKIAKFMCLQCGLSLDEIRGGETKNRVTD
jgi:hypothetical protein